MTSNALRALALATLLSGCLAAAESDLPDDDLAEDESAVSSTMVPHFDIVTLGGCGGAASCPASAEQCVCEVDFDHANYARIRPNGSREGHYVGMATDARRDALRARGNRPAYYADRLNDDWESGGAARADAFIADARARFGGTLPAWFLFNEISRRRWLDPGAEGARYRRYVADFARRLHRHHGRSVILFSPFRIPGADGQHRPADWQAVAENAFIGIESYIGGGEVRASGYSEAHCRARYQESLTWFGRMGVSADRLVLTEHFAQTVAGFGRGREGLSIAEWERAIRVRTRAARSLPFVGYASYAWGFNQMRVPSSERLRAMDAYHDELAAGRMVRDAVGSGVSGGTAPTPVEPMPVEPPPDPAPDPTGSATCGGVHEACVSGAGECCSGLACSTVSSDCRLQVGQTCADVSECTQGRACAGTPRRCCVIVGDGCAHDDQCCNGHACQQGMCCVRAGDGCARDDQCCSGQCTLGRCE
ncbi:MAG: hypothetical protein AB7S26_20615 [Sandaracinaceae bacterium]